MLYEFKCSSCDTVFTKKMMMSEKEAFISEGECPNCKETGKLSSYFSTGPNLKPGQTKPPSDFQKYVLGRMAESIPGNTIREQSKFGIPREF